MVLVKNLNNTSWKKCPKCGAWKNHWEKFSGKKFNSCSSKDCDQQATLGAHVIIAGSVNRSHYIIPLCHKCNKRKGLFDVKSGGFVSAVKCRTTRKDNVGNSAISFGSLFLFGLTAYGLYKGYQYLKSKNNSNNHSI